MKSLLVALREKLLSTGKISIVICLDIKSQCLFNSHKWPLARISPHNINIILSRQVMRIMKNTNWGSLLVDPITNSPS